MKLIHSGFFYLTFISLLFALLTPEVEARRKILRGRKTLTRTYLRDTGLPAWAIVLISAICEIVLGLILFFVLKKLILDQALQGQYQVTQTNDV
ncbi:unnamed protein product [Brassicogethes aeneus]|uniref:ABC transporter permease n=1 Tax=Brassicogethes aeneus TaxID=1431903 RepID=A0A9P0ATY9_BRAAE|nr:unnamed protein product [Brassicogethes aeneus]